MHALTPPNARPHHAHAAQVAHGMYHSLPSAAAAGLVPLGPAQLLCCPEDAVPIYTLPPCAAPPPHNAAPATPLAAAQPPAKAGLPNSSVPTSTVEGPAAKPADVAGASTSGPACTCAAVHADSLLAPPIGPCKPGQPPP